jgi:hypothetical protein
MKTAVVMKRELFGREISQNSKNSFFSATDLIRAGNAWRIANYLSPIDLTAWLRKQSTKDFIEELERQFPVVKISARGRGQHTWLHPYLFIDLALDINPKLKVQVYSWLYDSLIQYRNSSGDSYKKMCSTLGRWIPRYQCPEAFQAVADIIRINCGVSNWQTATQEQLQLRDKIHEYVILLSDVLRDTTNLVEVAIEKAKKELESKRQNA